MNLSELSRIITWCTPQTTWVSHVTYECVMSYINESCHIWMSHVTYEWVMAHMNESCHIWMSHVTYEWVIEHSGFSSELNFENFYLVHSPDEISESCHILMSHVIYEWVMSHMNESWHVVDLVASSLSRIFTCVGCKEMITKILKCQLATQFTILTFGISGAILAPKIPRVSWLLICCTKSL